MKSKIPPITTHGYENFPEGVGSASDRKGEPFRLCEHPQLRGKRALVTGAGIGVGRGIALELARQGAEVALHYYNEADTSESAKALIEGAGGKCFLAQADFSDPTEPGALWDVVEKRFGGLDILVNNAGITANAPFLDVSPEMFDRLMNVNMRAMYFLTQRAAASMMKSGGGTIVNLSSLHAEFSMNEHSVYAMSKAAVTAFTRNIALELAPHHIRVNAIAPGWCFGENHQRLLGDESRAVDAANTPAGYLSTPRDVGRLVAHLCHPDLDYFVGQTLVFDGGLSAILPTTGRFSTPISRRWGSWYLEE